MVCTFFGHGDTPLSVKPQVENLIRTLIEKHGVNLFYVGNHGNFDKIVTQVLKELQTEYSIEYYIILAYMPTKGSLYKGDNTLYPDGLENVPPKYAIIKRNEWMINNSDIVVTYVRHDFGSAAKFKATAVKKNKQVFELFGKAELPL